MTAKSKFFQRVIVSVGVFSVINVSVLHYLHVFEHGTDGPHFRRGISTLKNIKKSNNDTVSILKDIQAAAAFIPTHEEFKKLSHAQTNERRQRHGDRASGSPDGQQKNNTTVKRSKNKEDPDDSQKKKEETRKQQKDTQTEALVKGILEGHNVTDSQIHAFMQLAKAKPPPSKNVERRKSTTDDQRLHNKNIATKQYGTDVIVNAWDKTRYFCGKKIPPHGTIPINDTSISNCESHDRFSRLWPVDYTLSYNKFDGLDPILFHWNGQEGGEVQPFKDCDVPCTFTGHFNGLINRVTFHDLPIVFDAWSMEGDAYYTNLELNPDLHKRKHYLATTSFKSDIPLPYYSEAEYNIQLDEKYPPVQFDDPNIIKGASFIARNCGSKNGRERIVQEMIDLTGSPSPRSQGQRTDRFVNTTNTSVAAVAEPLLRIESVSTCLHNVDFPGADSMKKEDIMRSYLFHLSFENSRSDDYITEKLWGALRSGIVPVYMGPTNIHEHLPPGSAILVDDFNSTRELVDHMTEVAHNRTLYDSYHAWRFKDLPDFFHRKYDMTRTHSVCRVCRFAWSTRHGWGWDHVKQESTDTRVPRMTCIHRKTGIIAGPVREKWEVGNGNKTILLNADATHDFYYNKNDALDCSITNRRVLKIEGTLWKRVVSDHDGVTDLEVGYDGDRPPSPVRWMLKLPVNSTKIKPHGHDKRVFWIQDDKSRIVLAFDQHILIESRSGSDNQIMIHVRKPFRLRILVVDIDTNSFHNDGTRQESYFESTLIDDFFCPLLVGNISIYDWMVSNHVSLTKQQVL